MKTVELLIGYIDCCLVKKASDAKETGRTPGAFPLQKVGQSPILSSLNGRYIFHVPLYVLYHVKSFSIIFSILTREPSIGNSLPSIFWNIIKDDVTVLFAK